MTIVRAIEQLNPDIVLTYLADNAFFPYGKLTEDALIKRCCLLVEQALGHHDYDAVVIACNTASTVVLDALRAVFSVPIIGVVPPIKTAGEKSKSRVIGLLATEGTIQRSYIDDLADDFAADCQIVRVGCPDLAPLAEEKIFGNPVSRDRLCNALAPMRIDEHFAMDVIILGCTHFPILLDELKKEIPGDILWLDPADPVAQHLNRVLKNENGSDAPPATAANHLHFTADVPTNIQGNDFFKGLGFSAASKWSDIIGLT